MQKFPDIVIKNPKTKHTSPITYLNKFKNYKLNIYIKDLLYAL